MKRFIQSTAMLGIFLVVLSCSAMAQGYVQDRLTVDVPFSFDIGHHSFTPGTYTVQRASQSVGVYFIRNNETNDTQTISGTSDKDAPMKVTYPRLVFRKYGGRFYLAEVWTSGLRNGSELGLPNGLIEIGQANMAKEYVTVAAL